MDKKITLSSQYWHWTCGDGCCDEYGEKLLVNGEDIGADLYEDAPEAIEKILKYLGYEVKWEHMDDKRIDCRPSLDDEEFN